MQGNLCFIFFVILLAIPSNSASQQLPWTLSSDVRSRREQQHPMEGQVYGMGEEANFHISRPSYDAIIGPLASGLEGQTVRQESGFSDAGVDGQTIMRKGRRRNKRGAIETLKNLFRKPSLVKFLVIAVVFAAAFFFSNLLMLIVRIVFIGWLALKAVELVE